MSVLSEPQIIDLGTTHDVLNISIPPSTPPATPLSVASQGGSRPPTPVDKPSVNFGPGVELLMNDKRKGEKSPRSAGGQSMPDVGGLDAQMDQLGASKTPSRSGLFNQALMSGVGAVGSSGLLDGPSPLAAGSPAIETIPVIAKATAASADAAKQASDRTWDGFAPFGDVPVDPDNAPVAPGLSPEEALRQKFKVLRDLERLERKGVTLSKQYTMESPLQEMQGEYETIVAEREKKASSKFQGRMLMAAVTGLEFLNTRFDPFDVKLDGWAEQVGENLDDYDEIFGELHEKYKSKAKMAPEIKLMFQLAGSAIMVHMTNSMFKSSGARNGRHHAAEPGAHAAVHSGCHVQHERVEPRARGLHARPRWRGRPEPPSGTSATELRARTAARRYADQEPAPV